MHAVYSSDFGFDKFSSRGFAAPKIAAACFVAANAFIGSVTVRGFNTSRGRSDSSAKKNYQIEWEKWKKKIKKQKKTGREFKFIFQAILETRVISGRLDTIQWIGLKTTCFHENCLFWTKSGQLTSLVAYFVQEVVNSSWISISRQIWFGSGFFAGQ